MTRRKRISFRQGFTIIELSIAMTFVSLLMIAIAILVVNMTNLYTKGVTIRDLNSVGGMIIDDFVRSIAASPPMPLLENLEDSNSVSEWGAFYREQTGPGEEVIGGRFCTGLYSYIWNTATLDGGSEFVVATANRFAEPYADEELRLVKVTDRDRDYCKSTDEDPLMSPTHPVAATTGSDRTMVLLNDNETGLVLYDFQLFRPNQSTANRQIMYSLSFVLGTLRGIDSNGGSVVTPSNMTCQTPADIGSEFNYCAINKFNISMRTTSNTIGGS